MNDLIAILKHIEKLPGIYFSDAERSRSIHVLQAFILGFQTGQQSSGSEGNLDFFNEWVATHYHLLLEGASSFHLISEHVGRDERKAYDEFFRLLPEYLRDKQEIGKDGILSRFCKVQDESMEALEKQPGDQ